MNPSADKAKITAYLAERTRAAVRRQAFDRDVTVSAIVEATLERHLAASAADQAAVLQRAKEIVDARLSRSD